MRTSIIIIGNFNYNYNSIVISQQYVLQYVYIIHKYSLKNDRSLALKCIYF